MSVILKLKGVLFFLFTIKKHNLHLCLIIKIYGVLFFFFDDDEERKAPGRRELCIEEDVVGVIAVVIVVTEDKAPDIGARFKDVGVDDIGTKLCFGARLS